MMIKQLINTTILESAPQPLQSALLTCGISSAGESAVFRWEPSFACVPVCVIWWSCACALSVNGAPKPLQAWTPSDHVYLNFVLPGSPHFLNQAPPRTQQLALRDFLAIPHFGHGVEMTLGVNDAAAPVDMWTSIQQDHRKSELMLFSDLVNLPSSQTRMPSGHVWSNSLSPGFPHFSNQAPPRTQQLSLPDFGLTPHLGHAPPAVCVTLVVVGFMPAQS